MKVTDCKTQSFDDNKNDNIKSKFIRWFVGGERAARRQQQHIDSSELLECELRCHQLERHNIEEYADAELFSAH